ncbi:hypothetical protein CUMW_064960 [Citrus unshiu]|nr:hypothetical protein CUMW_064960 [Citrus unshiu]
MWPFTKSRLARLECGSKTSSDDQIIKKPFAGERFEAKAGFDTLPSNESLLSFRFTLRGDWKFEYYLIVNIYLQLLLLFFLTIPSNLSLNENSLVNMHPVTSWELM